MNNKVNIILAGGGAKGAYELGVWLELQAILRKLSLEVEAYSGSSVGALNAALFACNTAAEAESKWEEIDFLKILTPDIRKLIEDMSAAEFAGVMAEALCAMAFMSSGMVSGPMLRMVKHNVLLDCIVKNGLFSREGLRDIIDRANIKERIDAKNVWVCCTHCINDTHTKSGITRLKPEYIRVNSQNYMDLLLASSAIPLAFGRRNIGDGSDYYRDGGLTDNVPIKPLTPEYLQSDNVCKSFIVIHLGKDDKKSFDSVCLDGCRVYHIFPMKGLRGILGTFSFLKKRIKKMKEQAQDEFKTEEDYIGSLRQFFEGDSDREMHFYRGNTYYSVDELYSAVRGIKSRKSKVHLFKNRKLKDHKEFEYTNDDFIADLDDEKDVIFIKNERISRFAKKIINMSSTMIKYIIAVCSGVAIAEAFSGGTLTPEAAVILAPVGTVLGPVLFGVLMSLFISKKSFGFIKQIRDYKYIDDYDGVSMIVSKDCMNRLISELEEIKQEIGD